MKNTFTYKTVNAGSPQALDKGVTEALQEGWELYAHPYVCEEKPVLYCQALTKEEKSPVTLNA